MMLEMRHNCLYIYPKPLTITSQIKKKGLFGQYFDILIICLRNSIFAKNLRLTLGCIGKYAIIG